jgi:REP element-mobilizing transposase RayT
LKGFDYSSEGAYYVTIVTWHRDCLFGEVVQPPFPAEAYVNHSDLGKIADECWRAIPEHFPFVELGAYVVMPNHVHGIIFITGQRRRGAAMLRPYDQPNPNDTPHKINVTSGSLGAIVRSYKSAVSYRANKEHNTTGIWQRNYYEHIIRDEKDLQNKTDYIETNPSLWDEDDNNPNNFINNLKK